MKIIQKGKFRCIQGQISIRAFHKLYFLYFRSNKGLQLASSKTFLTRDMIPVYRPYLVDFSAPSSSAAAAMLFFFPLAPSASVRMSCRMQQASSRMETDAASSQPRLLRFSRNSLASFAAPCLKYRFVTKFQEMCTDLPMKSQWRQKGLHLCTYHHGSASSCGDGSRPFVQHKTDGMLSDHVTWVVPPAHGPLAHQLRLFADTLVETKRFNLYCT